MPSIGPLVAYPLTPRGADGRLLTRSFEQFVDGAIVAGASAIGVMGSTGGFAYLPRTARKRIARTAVEVADGRVPVIVGVGALSTAEVVANLAEAHSVGAAGALLQPMAYQPLTSEEIYTLYRDASSASDIPIWVYNNPATTGHRFTVDELARLGRLSGVAGFKDRAANAADVKDRMDRIAEEIPQRTASRLDWGFSGDGLGAQILLAGASSWHSGLAGVLPEICAAITVAATSDHAPQARVLQRQLTPLSIIVRQYGGIRTAHAVAQMRGMDPGDLPRPLLPLPSDARALVRMALLGIDLPARPAPESGPDAPVVVARVAEAPAPAALRTRAAVEAPAVRQRTVATAVEPAAAASGDLAEPAEPAVPASADAEPAMPASTDVGPARSAVADTAEPTAPARVAASRPEQPRRVRATATPVDDTDPDETPARPSGRHSG